MDIKELASYIPTEDFREYATWIYIGHVFKAAGLEEADFDEWCQQDPEKYDGNVLAHYRSFNPTESPEHATNILLKIAREYGYTYQGKFDQLPSVALTPCYRTVNKPVDEELPPFETEKARTDTGKILDQIRCSFTMTKYVRETNHLGEIKIRPQQEKSYYLDRSDLDAAFEELERLGDGCAFLLNGIDREKLEADREARQAVRDLLI